ncbi:MAG TPA: gamma-glutamyltransferase [Chitinophagaceae bacterium]|nr:gamma-glutamyltransferase [Chitinophagaceae bacterium]
MHSKFFYIVFCSFSIGLFAAAQPASPNNKNTPYQYSSKKTVTCTNGVVVSAHPLASKAGLLMLQQKGNAFDAAIATQLALAVVYPGAGNLGGGGFMVARAANGKTIALDYREKAPERASRDMFLDKDGNPQMTLSQNGHLASGVPGTVAGIFATLKYAKLPLKTLIAPAIELAAKGFCITAREAAGLNENRAAFVQYNTKQPVFVKEQPWKQGDTLIQKDLARTLERIRDNGMKGFYEGETARLMVEEMQRGNGLISYKDLSSYQARERTAMQFPYKGYTVVTMPLPSSGGIIINQALKLVEQRNIGAAGFHSLKAVQLMVEVERRAYADRAVYMGDVDFVKVPVKRLTSEDYLRTRMLDYDATKAGNSETIKEGVINKESEETTHLSIIDKMGNAVSITTTLNDNYGSKTVVAGAGFILNDEMDDFSVKPGVPNMYGALGAEANAIAPGKRMLSSMTPTIVLKNNQPYIVVGTPGGTTIPNSVFQTLLNIIDFNLSTSDAVNKPKFHHQWKPDEIYAEEGFPASVADSLRAMGYKVTIRGRMGRTEVIKVLPNKSFEAVADGRGDDAAEGF